MLWEVLANSLDEHFAGRARRIDVVLHADGAFSVTDDGGGISPEPGPHGACMIERAVTSLHGGPTRDGHSPHVHVGLHGVGLAVVNALSAELELETQRDGGRWRLRAKQGVLQEPLRRIGRSRATGTTVRARPDPAVFSDVELSYHAIRARLYELAALSPSLELTLRDERRRAVRLQHREGLEALLASRSPLGRGAEIYGPARAPALRVRGAGVDVTVDAAMIWRSGRGWRIRSYVNLQRTRGGGSHVAGLLAGVVDAVVEAVPALSRREAERRIACGLDAAIHVRIERDTVLASPMRETLRDRRVARLVRRVVRAGATPYFASHPELFEVPAP